MSTTVEIDLERALAHLGGAKAGRDFMLSELRSRCGIFGQSMADQIEEQTKPKSVWTDGDVVQVVEIPLNVWTRGTEAWKAEADGIVDHNVRRGAYRVLRRQADER